MKVDDRFVSLYQAEYGAILRATYLLCLDRPLAEDATQEAFARALAVGRGLRTMTGLPDG